MTKSVDFVADPSPILPKDAKAEGRKFWHRFEDKLRSSICNDPKIRELLTGDGKLKDYLIAGVPLVTAALGMAALLAPYAPLLAILAAVFALIAKVGFQAYCEIDSH